MKAEWKEKWLAALRSGEYEQTTAQLRHNVGDGTYLYCCLGVLCNIVDPERWTGKNDELYLGENVEGVVTRVDSYPPKDVLELVGLDKADTHMLAVLNDGDSLADEKGKFKQFDQEDREPFNFLTIADIIEKVL